MSITQKLLFIRCSGEQAVKEEPQPLALQRNSYLSQFQLQLRQSLYAYWLLPSALIPPLQMGKQF